MADRMSPAELVGRLPVRAAPGLDVAELQQRATRAVSAHTFAEHWKYTGVDPFLRGLESARPEEPRILGLDQPGVSLSRLSDNVGSPDPLGPGDAPSHGRFPLADLALLISGDLLTLRIRQSPAQPIEISHGDGLSVPLLCLVDRGVELTLIERSEASGLSNETLYLDIDEGARVQHASAALAAAESHWAFAQVRVAAGAHYARQQYARAGIHRRLETHVLLTDREATTGIVGASVVHSGGHLDQQLVVEHRAPATFSRQRFHIIGAGKGSSTFNGRIHIHPGAPGSDAALSNKNLALHPDATINTKPELEIYTDDVKCAHGATVGQISAESLFYLRSRGLDEELARRLLCRAFLSECIEGPLTAAAESALLGSLDDLPAAALLEGHS